MMTTYRRSKTSVLGIAVLAGAMCVATPGFAQDSQPETITDKVTRLITGETPEQSTVPVSAATIAELESSLTEARLQLVTYRNNADRDMAGKLDDTIDNLNDAIMEVRALQRETLRHDTEKQTASHPSDAEWQPGEDFVKTVSGNMQIQEEDIHLYDNGNEMVVYIDLPPLVSGDSVNSGVNGRVLTITGMRIDPDARWYERALTDAGLTDKAPMVHTMTLPLPGDPGAVNVNYEAGLLEIRVGVLHESADAAPRRSPRT